MKVLKANTENKNTILTEMGTCFNTVQQENYLQFKIFQFHHLHKAGLTVETQC